MPSDPNMELFKQHREFQNKYAYFLLAIAASAIAFAIQKSDDALLQWPMLPLGLAVLSFGISFYKGIRHLGYVGAALGGNMTLIQLKTDTHVDQPPGANELAGGRCGVMPNLVFGKVLI